MDGTTIEDGQAGYYNGHLWLYIIGMTLQTVSAIAFDPSKTGKVVFQYGEMEDEYNGFTVCTNLSIDDDGNVSVCMVKGE